MYETQKANKEDGPDSSSNGITVILGGKIMWCNGRRRFLGGTRSSLCDFLAAAYLLLLFFGRIECRAAF